MYQFVSNTNVNICYTQICQSLNNFPEYFFLIKHLISYFGSDYSAINMVCTFCIIDMFISFMKVIDVIGFPFIKRLKVLNIQRKTIQVLSLSLYNKSQVKITVQCQNAVSRHFCCCWSQQRCPCVFRQHASPHLHRQLKKNEDCP